METPSEVDLLLSVRARPRGRSTAEGQSLPHKYAIAATRHQDAIDAGLDREIQQMADVADQLVTTLEKTVEELRRRAGVPPYDPANAYTLSALVAAPAPAPDFDAQLAAALASVPPPPGPPGPRRGVQ